tara:strand:- start:107 stop:502 length:396 start_codon:yes stop_codon:yes gene_type:complete
MDKMFKQIVLIQIILLPVLILLEIFFPVPEEIYNQPYFDGIFANRTDGAITFALIVGFVILLTHYVSLFLIYLFKPIGKPIFFWTLILLIASYLISPSVSTGFFAMLDNIDSMLSGATLVFLYLTQIKNKF